MVKSAVPLLTNCTLWQAMQICTRVQQLCIRLNSSKIHTSNNNLAACAAPFIPPHSSQLWIQHAYQLPQPCIKYPPALSISHAVHSARVCFSHYNNNLRIQGSNPFDHVDPTDLSLTFYGCYFI